MRVAKLIYKDNHCFFDDMACLKDEVAEFFTNAETEESIQIYFLEMSKEELDDQGEFEGWD